MANYTDSIAVAVLGPDAIVQGIGHQLKYFYQKDGVFKTHSFDIQFRDKICGIEIVHDGTNQKICVYGGRYLAICELKNESIILIGKCKLTNVISSVRPNALNWTDIDVVTTYNVAVKLRLNNSEGVLEIIRKSVCVERSTLYCSHIRSADAQDGWTSLRIFGGTALGEVLIWSPNESGRSEILYRFSTPMGVLFSITTSNDISKLFTTSDDRSVRFWALNWNENQSAVKGHELSLTCFGHMGRVFRSAVTQYAGQMYLISVGEDARVCCWDMEGQLVFRREIQSGPSLWNLTITEAVGNLGSRVYVTTSNGGLEWIDLGEAFSNTEIVCIAKDAFERDYPAKIRFLSAKQIICASNTNELKLVVQSEDSVWSIKSQLKLDFKSTVLEVSSTKQLIAVGGLRKVYLFKLKDNSLQIHAENQDTIKSLVRAVHWLDNGNLLVFSDLGEGYLFNDQLVLLKRMDLADVGKERWSTSVLSLGDFLLVADRHGGLSSFDCSDGNSLNAPLIARLKRVHGPLGITQMRKRSENTFLTVGHDGMIRTIHMEEGSGELDVWRSQRVPIKWIERIEEDLLLGFNDNHFIVWSLLARKVVLELDCGGGHRYWDFLVDKTDNAELGSFIFIKNRQLHFANVSLSRNSPTLLPDSVSVWHSSSTNCLKTWTVLGHEIVFSGGEEGLVKIHDLTKGSLIFRDDITAHIANVRAMDLRSRNDSSALLITAGGRAQMCVHRVEMLPTGQLEIREMVDYMFKGSDLCRGRKERDMDFDPETRFMCIFVDGENIFAGCSDGYIRVFHFNEDLKVISLVREWYYGKCILQITGLNINSERVILLTMATDGKINFWDVESVVKPLFVVEHHTSGINGFDCTPVGADANCFWIVTGGDDQGMAGSKLKIDYHNTYEFSVEKQFRYPYRHTAQLSGLKILDDLQFLSVGVDQRVLLNNLENPETYSMSSFTSVSDAKGMCLLSSSRVIIYGAGVEIVHIRE